jgi:hemolysin activation/secretion protein
LLKSGIVTVALIASAPAAYAQSTTAAGQLQQIPPAPAAPTTVPDISIAPRAAPADTGPAGAAVRIDTLRITGATVFDEQALLAASGFRPGGNLTLAAMRALAGRISAYYHGRGYFLAQAYVPEQDVQSGAVTIAVIEGQYGKVGLENHSSLSNGVAQRVVSGLDAGDIVEGAPLERRLLLLSDLPGIRVKSTLSPGSSLGTSDLLVDLTPGRRVTGSVEADNVGNRYTGTYRAGGTVNLNNPLGVGDRLSGRILAAVDGLAYGRVAYQAPVGSLTFGVAYAKIRYRLGREFESLDADGTADILGASANYPLIRSRNVNLYALADVEARWFEDRVGLVSSRATKRSRVASLGFSADSHDAFGGGGWSTLSAGWSFGTLDITSPLERAADALTARIDGGYSKIEFAAARLQTISGPLSLYAWVRGQYAFDNLDTSEKMELGGAYGVRAYPEGEAYGDQGIIGTAEARLTLSPWIDIVPGQLQAIGFIDAGVIDFAHDRWFAGPNHSTRSGVGGGLIWAEPHGFQIRASYAHRLGDQRVTSGPDRKGRVLVQLAKTF